MMNPQQLRLPSGNNLLLEGVDRCGKSTIAQILAESGYQVIHAAYNPRHTDIYHYYSRLTLQIQGPVVFDRSFLAELVYGPVLRGVSRLSLQEMHSLLELLAQKRVILLYLFEPQEILIPRLLATRETHQQVLAHLSDLLLAYEHYLPIIAQYLPIYTIRPSSFPPDALFDALVSILHRHATRFVWPSPSAKGDKNVEMLP